MAITPTWTSPIEYSTGQLVTAANMNAAQNNIQFLHTYGVRKAANGTANRIPIWANANELTDVAGFVFTGNGLGIGVDSPERPLHLRHPNAAVRIDRGDGAGPGLFLVTYPDNTYSSISKAFYMGGIGANEFGIRDHGTTPGGGGTVRLSVNANGAVAIGTPSSPLTSAGSLTVAGASRFEGRGLFVDGVGFFGQIGPVSKPVISGSRGGNAALANLLSVLASYGLITDSTSA